MPGLRFAIGAALAVALLIVAVFGLAATVQVAHHRSVTPDDRWRTLAFPDPTDWGLLADRSHPSTVAKTEIPEVPQARVAVLAAESETIAPLSTSDRDVRREMGAQAEAQTVAAQTLERSALNPPATVPVPRPTASTQPIVGPIEHEPEPVDVVAAIPATKAVPIEPAETLPASEIPTDDDQPLEPSERVGSVPGFPTAGHGFVPPEHPIALPVPLPISKPAIKKPQKKKVARRLRWFLAPPPLFGSGKFGADSKTRYDKNWTTE
jgi:hypothetical protein